MSGLFQRTPPPVLNKQDLDLGLGKSLNELSELRVSAGFKILELNDNVYPTGYYRKVINAKKSFKGGFGIQLINEITPESDKCDIYFLSFKENEVREIMDANFRQAGNNKWIVRGNQHLWIQQKGFENFELLCSDLEGKTYV